MRRLSCGAWLPARAELLQGIALALLRGDLTASLAYVDGRSNPADPPSRAAGGVILPPDCAAVREARVRARSCCVVPAGVFRKA